MISDSDEEDGNDDEGEDGPSAAPTNGTATKEPTTAGTSALSDAGEGEGDASPAPVGDDKTNGMDVDE